MSVLLLIAVSVLSLDLYAGLLIVARSRVYRVALYRPMIFNILLSIAPVVAAIIPILGTVSLIVAIEALGSPPSASLVPLAFLAVAAFIWIVFFPNSISSNTELNLSHPRADDEVPLWFASISGATSDSTVSMSADPSCSSPGPCTISRRRGG